MTTWFRRSAALLAATGSILSLVLVVGLQPASAAWRELGYDGSGPVRYLACKTAETGGYGPVWKLTLVLATTPNYSSSATFVVQRGASNVATVNLSASNGAWDVKTVYASRYFNDTWDTKWGAGQISTGYGLGYGFQGQKSFDEIGYC
jgi:hypothetical protein